MIINKSMIGSRFGGCSFDNFDILSESHDTAREACLELLEGRIEGVVLTGPPGHGKTHLMVALAEAFNVEASLTIGVDQSHVIVESMGNRIAFWPFKELASCLREEVKKDGLYEVVINECKTCDLLIIDDLGSERATEFITMAIEEIFDYRYRNNKPLAVTSNLKLLTIRDVFGPRLVSRLAETCTVVAINAGSDYRVNGGRED